MNPAICILTALSLAMGSATAAALHNPWSEVTGPAPGQTRILGGYSAGCIQGAESVLPDEGAFEVMRKSRKRFYAHPNLRALINRIAEQVLHRGWGKLLVGDMSQARGGPSTTGHISHQTGLDADIWYWLDSPAVQRTLTRDDEETLSAVSMLDASGEAVDPQRFGDNQVALLQLVAAQPEVERILVNPAIKKALCERTNQSAWLNKVRPWWGHHYHFHVRLACPPGQTGCKPQGLPPANPQCGKVLDWWFSAEAEEQARKNAEAARELTPAEALEKKLARVPKACRAVLAQPTR